MVTPLVIKRPRAIHPDAIRSPGNFYLELLGHPGLVDEAGAVGPGPLARPSRVDAVLPARRQPC